MMIDTAAAWSLSMLRKIRLPAVAAWNAPAAPPGVGISEPSEATPITNVESINLIGKPNARITSQVGTAIDIQSANVQKTARNNSLGLRRMSRDAASCLIRLNI